MNSDIREDDSERIQLFKTQHPWVYKDEITTLSKEEHTSMDEISTNWERSPIRRVNLVSGPQSAFARLFPDKYRRQEDKRSLSTDNQRSNVDRLTSQYIASDDDDDDDDENNNKERLRKSRRVRFYTNEDDSLKNRAKSESHLNEIHSSSDYDFNYDPNPEIIYHDNPDKVVYTQKVGVRYLRPPTPPPPGPLVIREIQSTLPNDPPPLVVSTNPPTPPRTPSPLIVREQPPTPPVHQPTKFVTKTLPPPPTPPRRVVIKRLPPLPAKPRPVIIEKWLPYKPTAERSVLYQRAEKVHQTRPIQRNLILQYQPPRVQIKQELQNFGCFRVDPKTYQDQHGSSLRRTESIRRVLQDIGCNADLITSTGYNTCYSSSLNQTNNSSHYDYPRETKTYFTDRQLDALIGTAYPTTEHLYDTPKKYDEDHNYEIKVSSV